MLPMLPTKSAARLARLTPLVALAGCGGAAGAGAGPSPDASLMVRVPTAASVQVMRYDTSLVSVEAGMMGTIEMNVEHAGTVAVEFSETPAGLEVTARYTEFEGKMANPMAGTLTADETDIGGELMFTLDSRGRAEVAQGFEVQAEVAQMVGSKALAYDLFPRFPDRSVGPGESWVDTTVVEEGGDFTSTQRNIVTYTVVGDTVVEGRTLLRLDRSSEVELSTVGEQQGMSMSQNMSGTGTGWMLWDRQASLTHSAYSEVNMGGTVTVDMAGAGDMALQVSGRSHTRTVY